MQGLFSAGFERHEAGPGVGLLKSLGVKVESGSFVWEGEKRSLQTIESRTSFIQSLEDSSMMQILLILLSSTIFRVERA